jgi:hypothetical protein
MSLIKPFRGLRPAPGRAAEIAAPPYDVLSADEARVRAAGKPNSFLHISKAEIDLPPEIDHYSPQVYAKSRENFDCMIREGRAQAGRHALLLRLPPGDGQHSSDRPGRRRLGRRLRHQPHPQARVHPPGQGGRPRAPDRGAQRPDRPGAAGASRRTGGRRHPGAGLVRRARRRRDGGRRHPPQHLGDPRRSRAAATDFSVRRHAGALHRRRPPPLGRRLARRRRAPREELAPQRRRGLQLLPLGDLPAPSDAHHGLQPGGEGPQRPQHDGLPGEADRTLRRLDLRRRATAPRSAANSASTCPASGTA